jgi:hypothetical protein
MFQRRILLRRILCKPKFPNDNKKKHKKTEISLTCSYVILGTSIENSRQREIFGEKLSGKEFDNEELFAKNP